MEIGHVKFIRPKDPKLRALIKGYYVHSSQDPNFYSKITFYQNITTTISIYKNSKTSSQERLRMQHYQENNNYTSLLAWLVDKYQEVALYVGDQYIQHNPDVTDGLQRFIEYFDRMQHEYPNKSIDFVRCIAEVDLVALHTHQT